MLNMPHDVIVRQHWENNWLKVTTLNGKKRAKFNNNWIPIYTHIHTHPNYYYFGDPGLSTGPNSDEDLFRRLGVPIHVIYNGDIFEADYYYNNWRLLKRWKW
jgi:hypothetical protein